MKYKDISEIYSSITIKDGDVILKTKNSISYITIYSIKPVVLLDLSESMKNKIMLCYKEFLRQVNFEFQILIINKKIKYEDYQKNVNNCKIHNEKLYKDYLKDMEENFKKEDFFDTYYYLVVTKSKSNGFSVDNVDNVIKILEKIGCKVNKVENVNLINELLNKCINKEE